MPSKAKIAIVSALEREVWPLVKHWSITHQEHSGRRFKFFHHGDTVAVCCGIGAEFARRATEAVIQLYQPELIVSAGFAGALKPELQVGNTIQPQTIIDATDGSRTEIGGGKGKVVSFASVAHAPQKAKLAQAYGADAVDMEAAAIARSAEARGVRFMAIKAISDVSGAALPPVEKFVAPDGQFQFVRFAFHIALRPWMWAGAARLGLDSVQASHALCTELSAIREMRARQAAAGAPSPVALKS
jgi:adenosylhomocysteine nucleosidase